MNDRVWNLFRAPEPASDELDVPDFLAGHDPSSLVQHWPDEPTLHAVCGSPCRLPAGHDGPHRAGMLAWDQR